MCLGSIPGSSTDMLYLLLPVLLLHVPLPPLERPATPTSIAVEKLPDVLTRAHEEEFGSRPSRDRLSMAVGQVRLEGLALPGKNLGGLEFEPGRPWVRVDRLTRLRAFETYLDAAKAYWRLMNERCRGALHAFGSGDPEAVVERLKACGYFHGSADWYVAGLRALRR